MTERRAVYEVLTPDGNTIGLILQDATRAPGERVRFWYGQAPNVPLQPARWRLMDAVGDVIRECGL